MVGEGRNWRLDGVMVCKKIIGGFGNGKLGWFCCICFLLKLMVCVIDFEFWGFFLYCLVFWNWLFVGVEMLDVFIIKVWEGCYFSMCEWECCVLIVFGRYYWFKW